MRALPGLVLLVLASAEEWCSSADSAADVCPRESVALLQTRMLRRAPGDLDHEDADEDPDPGPVPTSRPLAPEATRTAAVPPSAVPPSAVGVGDRGPGPSAVQLSSRGPGATVHVVLPPRNGTLALAQDEPAVEAPVPSIAEMLATVAEPPAPAPPATQAAEVEQQLDGHGVRNLKRGECLQPCENGICHDGECYCRYPYAGRTCTSKENLRVEMWAACCVFTLVFLVTAGVVAYVYVPQSDLDRAPQVEQDHMADEEWKAPAKHHG